MVGFMETTHEPSVPVKFVSAGLAACMADVATFPLDTAKVRLQIQGEVSIAGGSTSSTVPQVFKYRGIFGTASTIVKEEGVLALYNGLCAGLQRQMAFASIRIGLYDSVKKVYQRQFGMADDHQNILIRIMAGVTTGGVAVSIAQPTDVVKVRMQAQGAGGAPKRYSGTWQAYKAIGSHEGIRGLWKGVLPNIARNCIVNCCELVSYDMIKEQILKWGLMTDNMGCHFTSGFGAGFVTTVIASPVDVVKTRFMNSAPGVYRGALHCGVLMFREGGFSAFYKGFMPSFMRLGSWNIAMFVCYEQLKRGFTLMVGENDTL